jgi:N-acetylglutamate synthase-like GNAT family acetyltransferase
MTKHHNGIRELEKRDIHACTEIVRDNWGDLVAERFWDEIQHAFHKNMKWPPEYFVFEEEGEIVGFAGMMESWQMHKVMDFIWINVKREYQGYGIGRALTEYRIERCRAYDMRAINLMTQKPNFFEPFGFIMSFVYEGEGMWVSMTKQLGPLSI